MARFAGYASHVCSGTGIALSKSDDLAMGEFTRIGLQDDMTFIGSAAAVDRSWRNIEGALADAGHRLRGDKCGVWAPGFEQFEDAALPLSARNLCLRIPRKRHGVSLLGSEANAQHCMQVGLGQITEAPTQTKERVEKALVTLQNIERYACDQHDYVSFATAWMLMSKGVAHALDYDFRPVARGVMPPLQRRLEAGLRQTMAVLLGSEVWEMAWDRAKLPTCYGGLGLRVAQMGFAAQATYWSAVDLQKAVMPRICEALNRPIREPHPDVANALAAKVDLLLSGVAVDEHAGVAVENEASKVYEASPWALDKRAVDIVRPAPVQTDERVPPKSLARDIAFAKLQSRILFAAEAVQAAKLHAGMSPEHQAIMLSAGGPGTGTSWTAMHKSPTELAQNAQWMMAMMGICANSLWQHIHSTRFAVSMEEPETDRTELSSARCADLLSRQRDTLIWRDMSLSFMIGTPTKTGRHL